MARLQLRLTPRGRLLLEEAHDAPVIEDKVAVRLADAFRRGPGYGLLQLGAGEVGHPLPPAFVWWREFAMRYVGAVCLHASDSAQDAPSAVIPPPISPPTEGELATLLLSAPMMPGAEYLNADVLVELWTDLAAALPKVLDVDVIGTNAARLWHGVLHVRFWCGFSVAGTVSSVRRRQHEVNRNMATRA